MPRPFTKENAALMQQRAVAKRLENNERRFTLMRSTRDQLTAIKKPDDEDRANAEFIGVKLGKKPTVGDTLIIGFLAHLKRIGDVRGFMEVLKMSGMTFDQSPEALGGSENPLNVQAVAIAPKQVKDISEALEDNC